MNGAHERLLGVAVFFALCGLAQPVWAEDAPERKTFEWVYEVTEGAKEVGTETLRIVLDGRGSRFSSSKFKPSAKGAVPLDAFIQREPNGRLKKYRRTLDERKGQGLFAFQKAGGVRLVPVNASFAAVEWPAVADHMVWDPKALAGLAEWVTRLPSGGESVSVDLLDLGARRLGKKSLKRAPGPTVYGAKAKTMTLTTWAATDGSALSLYVGPKQRFMGARVGARQWLKKGWSLDKPEEPDQEGASEEALPAKQDKKAGTDKSGSAETPDADGKPERSKDGEAKSPKAPVKKTEREAEVKPPATGTKRAKSVDSKETVPELP